MMKTGDRVKTMPVRSSKRESKTVSTTGTVTAVGDTFSTVEMDNMNGMRVTFPTEALELLDAGE